MFQELQRTNFLFWLAFFNPLLKHLLNMRHATTQLVQVCLLVQLVLFQVCLTFISSHLSATVVVEDALDSKDFEAKKG